jgi:CRP-like cAMP-binding protein
LLANQKTIKKVRKKDIMFMEGDSSKYLYFVVSGKVKTYKTNEFGKDYITEIYKEKDFFGYSALFGDTTHKESAMAIENSEIATIPKQDFFQLLNSNSTLSLKFIKLLSSNYSESQEKLLKLAYDSSRKRVAEALLFISRKYQQEGKSEARFILQRENISSLAGISRESVSRNLSEFRDERLIETDNCSIKIIDVQKLERLKN